MRREEDREIKMICLDLAKKRSSPLKYWHYLELGVKVTGLPIERGGWSLVNMSI